MLIRTDTLRPWRGEALEGVRHPSNIEFVWTAQERATARLVRQVPATIPQGFHRIGPSTWDAAGVETIPTEPIPPRSQAVTDAMRDTLVAIFDETEAVDRALLRIILDEFNRQSAVQRAILAAIAEATSLADLKNRVATNVTAVPGVPATGIPDRTMAQLRPAIRNALGT